MISDHLHKETFIILVVNMKAESTCARRNKWESGGLYDMVNEEVMDKRQDIIEKLQAQHWILLDRNFKPNHLTFDLWT